MFSPEIIQQNIERVEAAFSASLTQQRGSTTKFQLFRFSSSQIEEMVEHLKTVTDKKTGEFTRDLTPTEQRFVDNERIMCQLDWRHFNDNYCHIQLAGRNDDKPEGWTDLDRDPGAADDSPNLVVGKFVLNGMQESMLLKLQELERREFDRRRRGAPVNGILLITLKARALGASAQWQSIGFQRTNFFSNINGLTASMDDGATQRMHRRYERIYEYCPPWLRQPYKHWTKDRGAVFHNGSIMDLQDGRQTNDLGKGEAWHFWHVTEASTFQRPEDHFDEGLIPATPIGMYGGYPVIAGMETTAKGKVNNWFADFFAAVKTGSAEGGAGRFDWFFAPFYLIDIYQEGKGQRSKYRMEAPLDWVPARDTDLMHKKVWETSAEFTPDKQPVSLHRDVLYWYERTRRAYYIKGRLNIFLQSWPITPDQAFQHTAGGAFTSESIERMDNEAANYRPWAYRILTGEEASDARVTPFAFLPDDRTPLPVFEVADRFIGPAHPSEIDKDPRGLIQLWELPDERPRNYVVSCDPTGGIPGWQRAFREHNDVLTDNGAVQVWRKESAARSCEECKGLGYRPTTSKNVQVECKPCNGRGKLGGRAVQCAEFAAPIDSEELALYVFLLGRMYKPMGDFEEVLAIVASANTGIITIRTLQSKYHYGNLYQARALGGASPKFMSGYGFAEGPTTVPVLHARSHAVLLKRDAEPRSPWLIKEYADAIRRIVGPPGQEKERFLVPPGGGRHDDRMTTSFLAFWVLFDLYTAIDDDGNMIPGASIGEVPVVLHDFAARPVSSDEQQSLWNRSFESALGGSEVDLDFGHSDKCEPGCEGCAAGEPDPDDDMDPEELLAYGIEPDYDDY